MKYCAAWSGSVRTNLQRMPRASSSASLQSRLAGTSKRAAPFRFALPWRVLQLESCSVRAPTWVGTLMQVLLRNAAPAKRCLKPSARTSAAASSSRSCSVRKRKPTRCEHGSGGNHERGKRLCGSSSAGHALPAGRAALARPDVKKLVSEWRSCRRRRRDVET